MSKLLTALTLALLLSLALVGAVEIGVASATHSEGEGPNNDFVRGTVTTGTGAKFHVNATSRLSGEDPKGHFYAEIKEGTPPRQFDFSGEVTCLRVEGNQAVVGGVVTKTKGDFPSNPPEGSGFLIRIADNGEPNQLEPSQPPDFVSGIPVPGGGVPDVCPDQSTTNPTERGNFVVHDATL